LKILKRLGLAVVIVVLGTFGVIGLVKLAYFLKAWESPTHEQEVVKK
jgi:hypothetical protein